jgi:hypothetical protein
MELTINYIHLLKECLTDHLYGSRQFDGTPAKEESVVQGNYFPERAHTMIGLAGLDNIQFCVEEVLRNSVPGDFLETGVWRGGASIFMRGLLLAHRVTGRKVYVADSFQGLPPPDPKYIMDTGCDFSNNPYLSVSLEQVQNNFRRYSLLDDQVVFLKGWFENTIPTAPFKELAILRLDGDLYSSTIQVLEGAYNRLSPGGYVIIDDYGALVNCKRAVDDFRQARGIKAPIRQASWTIHYWKKE